ncbi:MAG: oligosaccharide flippase family protein [Bacteroidota bacterium]
MKKLAGQTAIYGVSSILGRMINLLLVPLHTRVFQTGQYGVIGYFYAQTAFLNVVLTFGMETTFFRFIQDKGNSNQIYSQAFTWILALSTLLLAIILSFYQPIASFLGYPDYSRILIYVGIILALDALAALPMAMLRHQERATRFALITLVSIFINIGFNFLFLLVMGKGLEYVFLANILGSVAKTLLALLSNPPLGLLWDPKLLRKMLNYGGFIMLAGLAGTANQMLDRLMIPYLWQEDYPFLGGNYSGDQLLGIYQAIYKLAIFIALFTQAYRYAAEPFFFRSAQDKESPQTFARVFHYYTLATLAGFLFISSFASEIISFDLSLGLAEAPIYFIDDSYWLGLPVVPILLFAYVLNGMYFNFSIWFKITKQTRYALLFTSLGAICVFAINYFGIPQFGFYASAWGALICFALMALLAYTTGQKNYPIPYRIGRIGLLACLFLLAFYINHRIGPTENMPWISGAKLLVCFLCLGSVFLFERSWPIKWNESNT